MNEVNFTMYFGQDNKIEVETEVTPGRQAAIPVGEYRAMEPDDPPLVEITACYLVGEDDVKVKFAPDGLYIRPFAQFKHRELVSEIEERALEEMSLYK